MSKAWISGNCIECSSVVIVTSSNKQDQDYYWQCPNVECINHQGSHTADDDHPDWVAIGEIQRQVILSQLDCKNLLDILSENVKQTGKSCTHIAKTIIDSRPFYGPMKKED